MKTIILTGLIVLLTLSSCIEESTWADDGPSRHDHVRWELEKTYASATEDYDLYGVSINLRNNDSIVLQCRDKYIEPTGDTVEIDIVIDNKQLWITKEVSYPDETVRKYKLEWRYHNTHSTTVEYYRHKPGFEYLNEALSNARLSYIPVYGIENMTSRGTLTTTDSGKKSKWCLTLYCVGYNRFQIKSLITSNAKGSSGLSCNNLLI